MPADPPRVVIDTNVLIEGITKQGNASGLIIDAWLAGLLEAYVSTALAYEYVDVLGRKLSPDRWARIQPVLGALLRHAHYVDIHFRWQPMSPDPGDDMVINCAMNAGAAIVTINARDFRMARDSLGMTILTPAQLVVLLADAS